MKILTIDIETRPNLAYVWDMFDQNVTLDQLVESKQMICFAAKWYGSDEITYRSEHHDGRGEMVRKAWDLLNEADAVVHYNGRRFDIPHLNREFVELGLIPPAPFKQIDLLAVVRKQFKFTSNKLQYVAEHLGIGSKAHHEGFQLWVKCMNGDEGAWAKMREYNIQDVRVTEALYDRIRAWIPNHPSFGADTGEDVCPTCGSSQLEDAGTYKTKTGTYKRFRCLDCSAVSRSTRRDSATSIVEAI